MSAKSPPQPAYRWVIAAASAAMLAVAVGQLANGLSVFVIPLETEFGWARGSIALINSACVVGIGLGGLLMGPLADRVGVRRVALVGAVAVGGAMLLAAQASALWQFYVVFFLAGAFGGGALAGPLVALTGNWFAVGSGLAIGIVAAGQGVGQGVVPFLTVYLIEGLGWRGALAASGLISLAILLPLAALLRAPPARLPGQAEAAENMPLPLSVVVPWLSAAALFCCTLMSVPLMHLVPYIQGCGISAPEAGGVLFLTLVAATLGRVAFGRLADMIGALGAYMAASAWQTALVFGFVQIGDLDTFLVFAPVYGFGYGGVMTGVLTTTRLLTPAARRATAMSVILAFAWLGHGVGGYQGGLFYDLTGTYTVPFANAAIAGIANLVLLGLLWHALNRRRFGPA
ncbi:MFS transporter [Defluviimonas salinarum]|uniref:MFS transporter n=1 Tax=Defluviimonas salinarum TaxID=2992147 RepID=A0ABT3J022_9RHOB|nr:MFS transporter [Defluviimonas salinarum]MCW3781036.1 MFS transporter [Defluviimonas salinarum]